MLAGLVPGRLTGHDGAMPFAQINGLQLYYEAEGEGTPALFIHCGFGGAESTLFPRDSVYRGVLPAQRFRAITYDRRNAGRSEYSRHAYKLEDLADDAAALLDHLDARQAVIVGDSLGGQ